jgi:hypothetical protein
MAEPETEIWLVTTVTPEQDRQYSDLGPKAHTDVPDHTDQP